jgi:tetratricopeptide (TPR) repeat protein
VDVTETAEQDNLKKSKLFWYNKGVDFTESQQYEQALMAYDQALTFDDKDPDIWNNKCYILNILAKYEEAVKAGSVALKISPQDLQIWNNLYEAYIGCNDREKADDCKKNIIKLGEEKSELSFNNLHYLVRWLVNAVFVLMAINIVVAIYMESTRSGAVILFSIVGFLSGYYLFAPFCWTLAYNKDRNTDFAFAWGFLTGVFGTVPYWIYTLFLKKNPDNWEKP